MGNRGIILLHGRSVGGKAWHSGGENVMATTRTVVVHMSQKSRAAPHAGQVLAWVSVARAVCPRGLGFRGFRVWGVRIWGLGSRV